MILALATTGPTTELWLFPPGATDAAAALSHERWESGRSLADGLLSHIEALCRAQKSDINHLTGIIILSGPGSFTSLRIGHTVANALADSLSLPVVGAEGANWKNDALTRLGTAKPGEFAWPLYGADAHVTRPKA